MPAPRPRGVDVFPAPRAGYELLADVSVAQGPMGARLAGLRAAGVTGVLARATDGHSADTDWPETRDVCAAQGMPLSAYGVVEPGSDPVAQAERFLAAVARATLARRCLDWEEARKQTGAQAIQSAAAWVRTIHGATGAWPTVYTGPAFVEDLERLALRRDPETGFLTFDDSTAEALAILAGCPLWCARWVEAFDRPDLHWPAAPAPWASAELAQLTGGKAALPGTTIPVDVTWGRRFDARATLQTGVTFTGETTP